MREYSPVIFIYRNNILIICLVTRKIREILKCLPRHSTSLLRQSSKQPRNFRLG